MPPQYFVIISKTGALGLGEFPYPEWHKKEKENILSSVGIKVEYGELVYEGEYKGTFRTVGDKEHAEIIRLYIEEGLGINKIAEMLGRSSQTPLTQIQKHNKAVERSGSAQFADELWANFFKKIVHKKRKLINATLQDINIKNQ